MQKVAILSTHDISGGAAISAYRLFKGLTNEQMDADSDVTMYVMHKHSVEKNILPVPNMAGNIIQKVRKKSRYLKVKNIQSAIENEPGIEKFSMEYSPYYWSNIAPEMEFDLLNIHWVQGMIDFKGIYDLAKGKKVIFTLHDMAHFTGGCHYSKGCRRFESQCGKCPILKSDKEKDISRYHWQQKKKYIELMNAMVVTPSKWLAKEASKSSLFGNLDIHVIPNGVDTNFFKPAGKTAPAQYDSIPTEKILLLTGALDLTLQRKGADLLREALACLPQRIKENICLLTFGEGSIDTDGVASASLGFVEGRKLVEAYNMADLFVIPSREDNLPNTVIESLSCGLPAIGFDIGGIPDMITHGVNGFLAEPHSAQSLAEQIAHFVEQPRTQREHMRNQARVTAIKNYKLEIQAKNYVDLFKSELRKP